MQSLRLRNLLITSSLPKFLCRHYAFTVNLNVKAIDSLEIAADRAFGPNKKINVQVYDSQGRLQNGSQVNIMHHDDGFYMNYNRSEDDKLVVNFPLTARLKDFDVRVCGEKANVTIDELLMNSLNIEVERGDVTVKSVRVNDVKISTADNITVKELFGSQMDKIALNSSNGTVDVSECRCSEMTVIGKIVTIANCFNSINRFRSSLEMTLANILGNTQIRADGDKFSCAGFAGTIKAMLGTKDNTLDFLMVQTDDNELNFTHPDAKCYLSFSNGMASKLSKILINANPSIITQTADDFTLTRLGDKLFEIVRSKGGDGMSTLNIKVDHGRELKLHKQTWRDSFQWFKRLFN
ncbi:uncharacterized protein [Chironomus tepperi]|uniref:uncharacterized protein n=1 Tax=Chironomus tepperi TaxID=113505 RepID=UPI00391F474D